LQQQDIAALPQRRRHIAHTRAGRSHRAQVARLLVEHLRHRAAEIRQAATEAAAALGDGAHVAPGGIDRGMRLGLARRRAPDQALRCIVTGQAEPHRLAAGDAQRQAVALVVEQALGLQPVAQPGPLRAQVLFDAHGVTPA
jgi:hypothetical protein